MPGALKVPAWLRIACTASILTQGVVQHAVANEVAGDCPLAVGRVVSIQGKVELRRAPSRLWTEVRKLDLPLCAGDLIHTGKNSRAAVVLKPETVVRLDQASTLSIRISGSDVQVEMFHDRDLPKEQVGKACGAGYFFTRFPRNFRVFTPFLNASVEGTEFQIALACDRTELSVLEGRVSAVSTVAGAPPVLVGSGQNISAGSGESLSPARLIISPADSVQWALYFPHTEAVGRIDASDPCLSGSGDRPQVCQVNRAEALLRVGRVEEALEQLRQVREAVPEYADAHALMAVIWLAKGRREEALGAARRAVELSNRSSRAWLALSYAEQAHLRLDEALDAALQAGSANPDSSLVQSRIAEVYFALGERQLAAAAAQRAIEAGPNESRAYTMLGYLDLVRVDLVRATASFQRAIELDSTDAMPRLGLGLAFMRSGRLTDGREQIEIAVALDPIHPLLRSYLGKAYFEESTAARDKLAHEQYALARAFDTSDPTPHLYEAILLQSQNRSIEALQALRRSIEKNDNRAIYRARFALDQDRSAKSAELGKIYRGLGYENLALTEGARSLGFDPGQSAAHELLADAYSGRPRHEIARVSERLQAQLLQPVQLKSLRSDEAFASLLPHVSANDIRAGLYEYSTLTQRNGVQVTAGVAAGNQGKHGSSFGLSGLKDTLAFGLALSDFQTDGFRPNNDFSSHSFELFGQADATSWLSLQADISKRSASFGHLDMDFDPNTFESKRRQSASEEAMRAAVRITPDGGRSTILLSFRDNHVTGELRQFPTSTITTDTDLSAFGNAYDVQYLVDHDGWSLVAGSNISRITKTETTTVDVEVFPGFVVTSTFDQPGHIEEQAHYAMLTKSGSRYAVNLGLTYDAYREGKRDQQQYNPRVGLMFSPVEALRIRAAYFRTLKRELIVNATVEPTQTAGFNMFYDDFNGSLARVVALGADARLGPDLYVSAEHYRRRLDIAGTFAATGDPAFEPGREDNGAIALNWSLHASTALTLGHQSSRLRRTPINSGTDDPVDLKTNVTSAKARIFLGPTGIFTGVTARYLKQQVARDAGATSASGESSAHVLDLDLGWRFPRRRGAIALEVRNIFDRYFFYQDSNFRTPGVYFPEFVPERIWLLKGSLQF